MGKIIEKWLAFWGYVFNRFWVPNWSNFRWHSSYKDDLPLKRKDRVTDIKGVRQVSHELFNNFVWTNDGVTELYDSIIPPPQGYKAHLMGVVRDDCDGFHSILYHILSKSGYKCYLLGVFARGGGHCVLLFEMDGKWHVCDYTVVYAGYATAEEAVEAYNKDYPAVYGSKSGVYLNTFIEYDYMTGKLRSVKKSEVYA